MYIQIEQTAPDISSASNFRSWLRETQDSLNKFSLSLGFSTLARRLAAVFWSIVIALVAVGNVWSAVLAYFARRSIHLIYFCSWACLPFA